MFSLDMNKELWKDDELFNEFFTITLNLNKTVIDQNWDASLFLNYANSLDKVMQAYEGIYSSIEDPIFYWTFATANALFLIKTNEFDEVGYVRFEYVLNGFREGLSRHQLHPSYPAIYITKAFEYMSIFAKLAYGNSHAEWIEKNRDNFVPI
jgi:hypothetical protein